MLSSLQWNTYFFVTHFNFNLSLRKTIIIRATESDKEYLVEVIDDGVGYDPNVPPSDGRVHVGVTNVKNRLKNMVNGRLEIYSKIDKGTRMSIHIPKGE